MLGRLIHNRRTIPIICLFVLFTLPADMCGGGGSGGDTGIDPTAVARAVIETQGTSISQTPGSCVATHLGNPIPDSGKWYSVQVATSHHVKECPSRDVQLVELRGWIHDEGSTNPISQACNPDDPDWHYALELDSAWAVKQGLDLSQLFRVGNMFGVQLNATNYAPYDYERHGATPEIEMELWGWKSSDHPGQTPPADWGFASADTTDCAGVLWPFNPVNPLPWQPPLRDGQYVRVVGSLVTDDPHEDQAKIATYLCSSFSLFCSGDAKANEIKQKWGSGRNHTADDPARWTEIHPPDLIAILPDPGHAETLREVAVFSDNCLIGTCRSQTIDEDIAPPSPCPAMEHIGFQELVGQAPGETNLATVSEGNGAGPGGSDTGANVTVLSDHIHVHVTVRGQSGWGAYGRFKALYRVFCTA